MLIHLVNCYWILVLLLHVILSHINIEPPDFNDPLILRKGCTVEHVVSIHVHCNLQYIHVHCYVQYNTCTCTLLCTIQYMYIVIYNIHYMIIHVHVYIIPLSIHVHCIRTVLDAHVCLTCVVKIRILHTCTLPITHY